MRSLVKKNPSLEHIYANRPLVLAHRGASAYAPMNTLAAFELALEQGADGIELDVHRTADDQLVIVHDFSVDETTDGSGVVAEMTLDEINALDAGSWYSESFIGVRVPTLDEVFELINRRAVINVEIKSLSADGDGVEALLADCIRRNHMAAHVIVSSFNPYALARFREAMPAVPIGFLYTPEFSMLDDEVTRELRYEAIHPFHEIIDAEYVAEAHQNGRYINTWTVNDPVRARALASLGVDAIMTDYPDRILQAVGR
jgi:glycerophosphoryl diester phosphodiesterase